MMMIMMMFIDNDAGNLSRRGFVKNLIFAAPSRYARTDYARVDLGGGCSTSVKNSTQVFGIIIKGIAI